MQKISYVIPCYRSQHTVGGVVAEIAATMQTLPQYDYEVILVNDCSPDDTFGTIRSLVAADSHVVGVDLAKNFGQHAALMAGFHKCSGDIVVCLDDDGQTPADEVGKLLAKIDEGYDVVYASYDTKRQAGWRNLGSWVNSKMTEIMLGKPPELVVNSYFAARRFIVDEMLRYEHCYPYVIGLVLRSTKRICNVPVHHRAREEGRSGYTLSKLLNLWMNGFTSFSVKPLRIATYIGTLFAVAGFLYFIYIIIDHFTRAAAPIGWASTTALLLLLGGMILVVLGIMGEYVGRIYMCANAAPQYVERESSGMGRTTHEAGEMVPAAACDPGHLCGQQRVQQAGRAAAVFERGVYRAVRPDAAGACHLCGGLAAGHQASAADDGLREQGRHRGVGHSAGSGRFW